jgi:hypothetical protein
LCVNGAPVSFAFPFDNLLTILLYERYIIMKKAPVIIIAILFIVLSGNTLHAQTKDTSKINISTDFVSRYVWRGVDYGKAPSIQPTFSLTTGGFEIGVSGAFSTNRSYYELDPYVKYTLKNFTLTFTDYFVNDNALDPNHTSYFNYDEWTTNHVFEGSLQYKGPDKFPISILVATFFYGNDPKVKVDTTNPSSIVTTTSQYYSTYIELGYSVKYRHKSFDLFLGMTPEAGFYGNTFGMVNAGITAYRNIDISNKFSLPVKASIIANPQARNLFLVFGFTL